MAYTALENMRQRNRETFGQDVGPFQPLGCNEGNDLLSASLRFLRSRCEGLRFDPAKESSEKDGPYLGKSTSAGQIPYNMEMDIDRLCLERELCKFIGSGSADDAYTVYYCYMHMFFGKYKRTNKMIDLLSEFESNGSSILMKHRDHYSHSAHVFALGLAIYETNELFRNSFKKFYCLDGQPDNEAACCFLEFWGLSALFHDIGYPFELPFEQVISYYEVAGKKRSDSIFISYNDMEVITSVSEAAQEQFEGLFGRRFGSVEQLLAFGIASRLGDEYGISEEELYDRIHRKPIAPDEFQYYMDHAYFSAVRLYGELTSMSSDKFSRIHLDSLTAIILHNSLFKFSVRGRDGRPLKMDLHPLAYLLMLCDELQCWDRKAYGRNSRRELHPMDVAFDFTDGSIKATYYFDSLEQEKIDDYLAGYEHWEKNGADPELEPKLKAYSNMAAPGCRFAGDIRKIVDMTDIRFEVCTDTRLPDPSVKHSYLSSSNFLHLYDFAVSLNARYSHKDEEKDIAEEQLEDEFDSLSLEYQLSNINQAENFGKYLDSIGCFYTDRQVEYEMVTEFTAEQTSVFAPMEHERWVREHIAMGWSAGDIYETASVPQVLISRFGSEKNARKAMREQFRMHKLTMHGDPSGQEIRNHYEQLPTEEQGKDFEPFNSMLRLIKKYDGLRIYKLN